MPLCPSCIAIILFFTMLGQLLEDYPSSCLMSFTISAIFQEFKQRASPLSLSSNLVRVSFCLESGVYFPGMESRNVLQDGKSSVHLAGREGLTCTNGKARKGCRIPRGHSPRTSVWSLRRLGQTELCNTSWMEDAQSVGGKDFTSLTGSI